MENNRCLNLNYRNLFISCLLFVTFFIRAQTDFRSGYIVTHNGDTLYGYIDYRGDMLMSSVCKFRTEKRNAKIFSPDDISSFSFINGKSYDSRRVQNKNVFLQNLMIGEVNIYYFRDDTGDHYYIDREGFTLSEIPYKEEVRYIGDKQYFYQSKEHIGILINYMQDVPEVHDEIYGMKKPQHYNLIKLAKDYHKNLCGENCIDYVTNNHIIQLYVEPFFGITTNKNNDNLIFEFGSNVYFGAPRTNEKLYFKTGVSYSYVSYEGNYYDQIKIPLQIQYVYPFRKVLPKVSIGLNIFTLSSPGYNDMGHSLCLNVGAGYKISEKITLNTGLITEFTPSTKKTFFQTNFGGFSYSFIFGLGYRLY